jgi:hypothetical protein
MELRQIVMSEESTPDQIKEALATYRAALVKAKENLVAARKDLKEACDARQEAAFVVLGLLE